MHRSCKRTGTTYIVVLGAAALVGVIGYSGLFVARLQLRRAADAMDWDEAGVLALSAVDFAQNMINVNGSWRTAYTNNVESSSYSLGNGKMSFKLVDAAIGISGGDGSLSNNNYDPVRLYGIGRVNNAIRVYSVLLQGDTPLPALKCALACSGALETKIAASSTNTISTNGNFKVRDIVNAPVDAGSISYSGSGQINGPTNAAATAKTMPDRTVFDAYVRIASTMPWSGGGTWNLSATLISPTTNNFASSLNSRGIYYIQVPSGKTLNIQVTHIQGTLVIDCPSSGSVQINQAIYWEPASNDLPILLIRHGDTSNGEDILQPPTGTVTEGAMTYRSCLNGLVHIMGTAGSQDVRFGNGSNIVGPVLIDEDCVIKDGSSALFGWNAYPYVRPPVGYSTGSSMAIVTGSAKWETYP